MLFLTLWFLVLILERTIASKQRSVNLALETVLQFDKPDDINVINKVQDFLSHIKVLLDKKPQISDNVDTRRKIEYKFTDFVEDLITTVNSFEDNDLKQIFRILDKDFRTRRLDNDLIDDKMIRRFLSRKLTEIKNQPATNIRRDLDRILRELRANENNNSGFFLDFINSLYKRDSERKLSKLIKRLNLFTRSARKSKVVLKNIIEKVVNDVIFEHYNNLEDNEKDYIKKFAKTLLIENVPTANNLKIEQRAKEAEITQESISTNEKTDESIPTKQATAFQLTPKTYKNIPKETTKKIFTHITLYPKTIRVKKMLTSFPILEMIENTPPNEENSNDKRKEQETKETKQIFTNQSVEINVNLLLKHSRDSLDREDSEMIKSFKFNSAPKKVFQRALKKSLKNTKYRTSSSPAFSIETFGNLYRGKTPKRYNYNEISRLVTYNSKTKMEDTYFKSTNVNDIVKENSVPEKKYFDVNYRRFNKPISLNDDKAPQSDVKDIFGTTKLDSFTKSALVPLIISTNKVTTPVVTSNKSTTKTTQNVVLNEILDDENLTDIIEVTYKPLTNIIRTNVEVVQKNKTTPFENHSSNRINNMTTVTEVSIAFNINNYIKNSEILNLEDKEKKKQLEEKMRADFGTLLDTPPSNATTEGFTDIFKELEDAFEI